MMPGSGWRRDGSGTCLGDVEGTYPVDHDADDMVRDLSAEPGFEPGLRDPKSPVLPLHNSAASYYARWSRGRARVGRLPNRAIILAERGCVK